MGIIIASGKLEDAIDYFQLQLDGVFGGPFGILLTGTFANATVDLRLGQGTGLLQTFAKAIDFLDGTASNIAYGAPGLYYHDANYSVLRMRSTGGTDGVTDVDYTVFTRGRP